MPLLPWFLLTRPMRDVTSTNVHCFERIAFLLTRPMRDVTLADQIDALIRRVSTHTPHAGRDDMTAEEAWEIARVSTHTPHAGRDVGNLYVRMRNLRFLLTRPMRDVTP